MGNLDPQPGNTGRQHIGRTRPVDDHQPRLRHNVGVPFPCGQPRRRVASQHRKELSVGYEPREFHKCVGRITRATTVEFDSRGLDPVDVANGSNGEGVAIFGQADDPASFFLPRLIRNDKKHHIECQSMANIDCGNKVSDVRRVERAAKNTDSWPGWKLWEIVVHETEVYLLWRRVRIRATPYRPTCVDRHVSQRNMPLRNAVEDCVMNDTIGFYLNDIGKVPLLNAADERQLSRTIEDGRAAKLDAAEGKPTAEQQTRIRDAGAAKDRFIRANLRLVVSIARRYPLPQGMDLGDLVQEGNLGLEHAVDKFDWRKGYKFSTYATFWIRQAIGRALDQKASLVRIPGDRSAGLRAALRQAAAAGGELDPEYASLHRISSPVSLDRSVGDDSDTTLVDLIPADQSGPEDQMLAADSSRILSELLNTLDDRARYAVTARFGLIDGTKRSFREVGDDLGVTAEAARRLVKRAVDGLRDDAVKVLSAA